MSVSWPNIPLHYLVRFGNGQSYEEVDESVDTYPVIGSGGEFARSSKYLYDGESVLFGRKGTVNRPLYVDGRFWTVDTMYYTIPGPLLEPKWLYYWATTVPFDLWSTSTALPSMTSAVLGRLKVPVPPRPEQRQLLHYLDRETAKIDALIEKQRALVIGLRLRRTALVASMMDRRVAQGRRLKWYIDEIDVRAGQRADELPLLSVSIDWGVRRRDEVTTDLALAENLENYKVACKGDLVINRMRAFQGALGVAPVDGLVSPDYAVLKCKIGARPDWLALLMRSPRFVSQMVSRIRGIGTIDSGAVRTPRINVSDLGEILVDVPSITQQLESVQRLGQESARMGALITKSERLIELSQERRAALIMAAVNGRIDVAEMDCEQEAA